MFTIRVLWRELRCRHAIRYSFAIKWHYKKSLISWGNVYSIMLNENIQIYNIPSANSGMPKRHRKDWKATWYLQSQLKALKSLGEVSTGITDASAKCLSLWRLFIRSCGVMSVSLPSAWGTSLLSTSHQRCKIARPLSPWECKSGILSLLLCRGLALLTQGLFIRH